MLFLHFFLTAWDEYWRESFTKQAAKESAFAEPERIEKSSGLIPSEWIANDEIMKNCRLLLLLKLGMVRLRKSSRQLVDGAPLFEPQT